MGETTRGKLPYPSDKDVSDPPEQLKALADRDEVLHNYSGATNAKATVISGEEARENTGFGTLTTPDRVTGLVVPAKALVVVEYRALWKMSVAKAGRCALFIGEEQLKGNQPGQEAAKLLSGGSNEESANLWHWVRSVPWGVTAVRNLAASAASPAAGPYASFAGWHNSSVLTTLEYNNGGSLNDITAGTVLPRYCVVEGLAEGTYEVSIRYRSTSGSITAKDRTLRVWTREFA